MSYMNELAAELVAAEARQRGIGPVSDRRPDHRDRCAGLLLGEVMQSAALTVVVSSLFNALEAGRAPPASLAAVRTFMPQRTIMFDAALIRLIDDAGASGMLPHVQAYVHAFDMAVRLAAPEALAADEVLAARPVEMAASAWRSLSSITRTTALALADHARAEARAGRTSGLKVLRHLSQAAAGGTPALQSGGGLLLPDWAERRRSPRVPADESAAIGWRGRMYEARIEDMSETGARVRATIGLKTGERATLVRASGETRAAIVRWVHDGALGLEYATRDARVSPAG